MRFRAQERQAGKTIYPSQRDLFNAFRETLYHEVKVVILGQDPYHGARASTWTFIFHTNPC